MRNLTGERKDAHDWLVDMAAIKRREAAKLIKEAEWFERSAAVVAGSPWDTVPMAAVAEALVLEPEKWFRGGGTLESEAAVRKPSLRTASRRLVDATREQMRAGATSVPAIAKTVGCAESHIRLAMRALIDAGEVVRTGPRRGPGASYRLATIDRSAEALWRNPEHGKEVVPNEAGRKAATIVAAQPVGENTTAPAEIPPAAPPVPARDHVEPAAAVEPTCERCGGPRHPGSAKLCRKCYRAGVQACAEAVADNSVDRVDNTPGAVVLDMLREAGPAGVASRALRTESGLHVMVFKGLMQMLIESGKVECIAPAERGAEKIYRLSATKDLRAA